MKQRSWTPARPSDSGRDRGLSATPDWVEGLDSKARNLLHHTAARVVDDGNRHLVRPVVDSKMAFDRSQDLPAARQPQPAPVMASKPYWPPAFRGTDASVEGRLSSHRVRRAVSNRTPGDDPNVEQERNGHESECGGKDVGTGLEGCGEALRRCDNLPRRCRIEAAADRRKGKTAADQRGYQPQAPKSQPLQLAIIDCAQTQARLSGDPPQTARDRRAHHRVEGSLLVAVLDSGVAWPASEDLADAV